MTGYILDCCTLLNLYCGWGGLHDLHALDGSFHIGATVASEALYVREYSPEGQIARRKLDLRDVCRQYPLARISLSTQREKALMVRLAGSLDDGEAEGLAMAACRGLGFCTDDGAVHKLVGSEHLNVRLVSTPELLQAWAGKDPHRQASLPHTVRRATELGKFSPHRSSPHSDWWIQLLSKNSSASFPEAPQ